MPNWCENHLTVSAETKQAEKQLKEFLNQARRPKTKELEKSPFCFSNFLPTPQALIDTISNGEDTAQKRENKKKYGHIDWYEWQVANWGTKWDISECYGESIDKFSAGFDFDTAWGPPTNAILAISKMFPLLSFSMEYSEPCMAFGGNYECQAGKVITDESHDIFCCQECSEVFTNKKELNKDGLCIHCRPTKKTKS